MPSLDETVDKIMGYLQGCGGEREVIAEVVDEYGSEQFNYGEEQGFAYGGNAGHAAGYRKALREGHLRPNPW